jgi:UDP-N-acetylmuramoyl-tripeptide--D-alanyl-D-alanine ligase
MEQTSLPDLLHGIAHRVINLPGQMTVSGVCTDTRKLEPGDLFVALRGEKSDGHNYVRQAREIGAVAAVVDKQADEEADGPLIVVEDTLRALGEMARNYRRRFQIPIVGITGSVGKTSVRELTAAILRTRYRTLSSEKNFNNEIGVPHTLFELSSEHEAAVIEMGMRALGEIDWLAEISEPNIALITNIGHSHIERLGSREGIAQAKAELLARLPRGGIAILPAHDGFFKFLIERVPQGSSVISYSDSPSQNADVCVERTDGHLNVTLRGERFETDIDPSAPFLTRNIAAGFAVGLALNIPFDTAKRGLLDVQFVEGRLRTLRGPNGRTVIDDCYNAAPESMAVALELLGRTAPPAGGRRVAILGDMRELGEYGPALHLAVGQQVVDANVDLLVTIGDLAEGIARGAERCAAETKRHAPMHSHFSNTGSAAPQIEALLSASDVVLVKGSRAMEMEQIVATLTGEQGAATHG